MSEITSGQKIRQLRKQAKLTQLQLGKAVGVSAAAVTQWEKDETRPAGSSLIKLATLFQVDATYLLDNSTNKEIDRLPIHNVSEPPAHYGRQASDLVPLISDVTAGNWREAIDNFSPGDAEDWIPCYVKHSPSTYALRVNGPSMEPEFRNGEIIVVDPERAETNGSFVIAKQKDDNSTTFKKLIITEGKKYLRAENPDWPNRIIEIDGDWSICGVVIYSHRVYV